MEEAIDINEESKNNERGKESIGMEKKLRKLSLMDDE